MESLIESIRGGDGRKILKVLRQHKIRSPHEVILHGKAFVEQGATWMGDEAWSVYEQVFLAALDLHDLKLAQVALNRLRSRFPDSVRVSRLVAMKAEAEGDYDQATAIYTGLLEKNPANGLVLKRLVCIAKAKGNPEDCIQRLNDYIKVFQSDSVAWHELASLYRSQNNLPQAVFCYEELILWSPTNFNWYTKLGEVYYSMGGVENLRLARKYYAQSLELKKEGNFRALYGMCATCYALASSSNLTNTPDGAVNVALFKLANQSLQDQYATKPSSMGVIMNEVLGAQAEVVFGGRDT